jgi:WD40 repeat protein
LDGLLNMYDTNSYSCIFTYTGNKMGIYSVENIDLIRVAVGDINGTLSIINTNTKQDYSFVKAHEECISCLLYVKREMLLTGSWDRAIKLWNIVENNPTYIRTFSAHKGNITCLKQINGELFVSSGLDRFTILWDLTKFHFIKLIKQDAPVYSLLSLTTKQLISGNGNGDLIINNLNSGKCIQKHFGELDDDIIWSLEKISNFRIVSGHHSGEIKIWNAMGSLICMKRITEGHASRVCSILYLGNNKFATCGDNNAIKIWNDISFECHQTIKAHKQCARSLAGAF